MANLHDSVKYFMDNYMVYDNPYDVEIITNADDSVMAACNWPGDSNEDGYNLEIFFECTTLDEFIKTFRLRTVLDLKRITPAFMMQLFEQGKADVCCAAETHRNYYPIQFRKINDTMVAKDDHDIEHEVPIELKTPQEFRDYTEQCFLLTNIIT